MLLPCVFRGACFVACSSLAYALPPDFREDVLIGNLNQATGITFSKDGTGFLWEKSGKVFVVENGNRDNTPLIDISDEVGDWRDLGMVGVCLDPDFDTKGYIYLWYTVDHHHLTKFGTPQYDPNANEYFVDSIGRLTRYTLHKHSGGYHLEPNSRFVLVGRSMNDGPVMTHLGHHVGTVMFGEDGSLIATVGDGASWDGFDAGGPMPNSSYTAYQEGILRPEEDVGTFRAQMINSLSGKVLRLNPETGDGMPGNPWFNADSPRSPASRVWALGFRNPWRANIRPGSSARQPGTARPGVIVIGEVQEGAWDELNVVSRGGQNFGWPLYEGLTVKETYTAMPTANRDTHNPLAGVGGCGFPNFLFQQLLVQESLNPGSWPNPCSPVSQIVAGTPVFMHTRPVLDWYDDGATRTGTFNGPNPVVTVLGTPGCPVIGPNLGGGCPLAGVWYTGSNFPATWRGTLFAADFVGQWIHNIRFDDNDRPVEIRHFRPDAGRVVSVALNPADGCLYYISYGYRGFSELRRISYTISQPPTAVAKCSPQWGDGPLEIEFDGRSSVDPEGLALSYEWDFGDGDSSTASHGKHWYLAAPDSGPRRFDIRLRVTDATGLHADTSAFVTVNNKPPVVNITSPIDGSQYPGIGITHVPLRADVLDDDDGLKCRWEIVPHHNDHTHPDPPIFDCEGEATIVPEPCEPENVYWYEFRFTVTDRLGLETSQTVLMHSNCCLGDFNGDGYLDGFDYDDFVRCFEGDACPDAHGATDEPADFNRDGFVNGFDYDDFVRAFEDGC